MTSATFVGWLCCGLGAASSVIAAVGSLSGALSMRAVVFWFAGALLFFGTGSMSVLLPEARRRTAKALRVAFEMGREHERRAAGRGERDDRVAA